MIFIFGPHCSCPNSQVTSNKAPAHPHATLVAVYPALFISPRLHHFTCMDFLKGDVHRAFSKEIMERKQARAGNSMRHLRDIRVGVTYGPTDGRTDRPSYRDTMTH